MPTKGNPALGVRAPRPLLDAFDETARAAGTDRSGLMRQLMRWATQQPGDELPARLEESIPAQS